MGPQHSLGLGGRGIDGEPPALITGLLWPHSQLPAEVPGEPRWEMAVGCDLLGLVRQLGM